MSLAGTELSHPPPLELTNNPLNNPRHMIRIKRFAHRAAANRLIDKSLSRQQALNLVAQFDEALLLRGRLRLPAAPGVEAAERDARAKAFGEFGRVEHGVEER